MIDENIRVINSGGTRGGAWGTKGPPPPHILGKKKITEGRKASRASNKKPLLAQGLAPPLINI